MPTSAQAQLRRRWPGVDQIVQVTMVIAHNLTALPAEGSATITMLCQIIG